MISEVYIELEYINDIDITIAGNNFCLREWVNKKVW